MLTCFPSQDKHTNFDLNTHAPAMLRVPGVTDAGMRTKALTSTTDFFPTLADLALGHTIPSCPRMYNSSDVRFRTSSAVVFFTVMVACFAFIFRRQFSVATRGAYFSFLELSIGHDVYRGKIAGSLARQSWHGQFQRVGFQYISEKLEASATAPWGPGPESSR